MATLCARESRQVAYLPDNESKRLVELVRAAS
jgi:hypothetical protein